MKSMRVLLQNAIDYAGLFPPAGLDMRSAVANFAAYMADEDSWALGRFVVPVSRLDEFAAAAAPLVASREQPWRLAALSGSDLIADLETIEQFNSRHAASPRPGVVIDSLERKAGSVGEVQETMHQLPAHLQAYLELPIDQDPTPLLRCMASSRVRGKVRTGGVTAEAFPRPDDLLRFIQSAVRAKVPFKATAGLHHPLRADYRLTYAPDSNLGRMFGFLNVFLTAAWLQAGMNEPDALELLQEGSPAAFRIDDDGIGWRHFYLGQPELRRARREVIIAFGSCSFTEPISELQSLHLLERRVSQA